MKPRVLLIAAVAGLACGFCFRPTLQDALAFRSKSGAKTESATQAAEARFPAPGRNAADIWNTRFSQYLTGPLPPAAVPSSSAVMGPRAETAALLRMARLPVTADSIQEAVSLINAMEPSRCAGILPAIFARWAREAPDAALAAAEGLRHAQNRMALVWKVMQPAATQNDPGILAKLAALPPGIARTAAYAAITDSLPPEAVPEMLKRTLAGKPQMFLWSASFQDQLLRKLAETDKAAPLRLALETDDPAWRAELLGMALTIPSDDTDQTLLTLARDPRNAEGLVYRAAGALKYNTDQGLGMIAGWPEATQRKVFSRAFRSAFMPPQEGEKTPAIPPENLTTLLDQAARTFGADGLKSILAESALSGGVESLQNTAAWMQSRQDTAGLGNLTHQAATAEPFTTARWLATMPPSPARDTAISIFAETHAATDPESARAWAASITDPAKREAALITISAGEKGTP